MKWLLGLLAWWRARQRAMDHQLLIPQIVNLPDEQFALVFVTHASLDPAWQVPWDQYSPRDKALIQRATKALAGNEIRNPE